MNSREIVINSITHKGGLIPLDLGGTPTTGIHVSIVEKLRQYYGLEKNPVKVIEPCQMLGEVDEELREEMKIDVVPLHPRNCFYGFECSRFKEWKAPWGQTVLVPKDFNTTVDLKGDIFMYPQGDLTNEPSAKMTSDGYFFDSIIRQYHFDEENLNPEDNLEEYGYITQEDLDYYKMESERLNQTDAFVMANFGGTALGDIALVPAPWLKDPRGIRDITEWYVSLLTRPDYIKAVFQRQIELAIQNLNKLWETVGTNIHGIYICGTDFGTQNGPFISNETYDELFHPYYLQINNWIHKNTTWLSFKHSCGSIKPMIERLIVSGFDLLNPMQFSDADMDPREIKGEYGDRITFWGGGIDTQKVLPFGTPDEVCKQVLERCEILSKNGGFVFSSIHNIQACTPIENIVKMVDAYKEVSGK